MVSAVLSIHNLLTSLDIPSSDTTWLTRATIAGVTRWAVLHWNAQTQPVRNVAPRRNSVRPDSTLDSRAQMGVFATPVFAIHHSRSAHTILGRSTARMATRAPLPTNAVPTSAGPALTRLDRGATANRLRYLGVLIIACAQVVFATICSALTTPHRFPVPRVRFAHRGINAIRTSAELAGLQMAYRDVMRLEHLARLATTTACVQTTVNSPTGVAYTKPVLPPGPSVRPIRSAQARVVTAFRIVKVGERARNLESFAKFVIRTPIAVVACFASHRLDRLRVRASLQAMELGAKLASRVQAARLENAQRGLEPTRMPTAPRLGLELRVAVDQMESTASATAVIRVMGALKDLASVAYASRTQFAGATAMPDPAQMGMHARS